MDVEIALIQGVSRDLKAIVTRSRDSKVIDCKSEFNALIAKLYTIEAALIDKHNVQMNK